jgi:bacterioferritin-associated ferredoxin
MELLFTKIDFQTIRALIELIIKAIGSDTSTYEVQSDCNSCINAFCDFVHEKLKR